MMLWPWSFWSQGKTWRKGVHDSQICQHSQNADGLLRLGLMGVPKCNAGDFSASSELLSFASCTAWGIFNWLRRVPRYR